MARSTALTQPHNLTDELAEIVGKSKASRAEVTKRVWAYIKKNDLQDCKDKRTILPDDCLAKVIGKKPINMMKMTAKISKHILD